MLRFRCTTPAPPSRAISSAILHSVTVSMGEETNGRDRRIFLVRLVDSEISRGSTSLRPGSRMKSLNVNTSEAFFSFETKLNGKAILVLARGSTPKCYNKDIAQERHNTAIRKRC